MNFYQFYQILESKISQMDFEGHQILVYNLSPSIQIHSGIGERDKEYFSSIFEKGNASEAELEEFIHSYAEGWSAASGSSLGSKIIGYDDGKVVLGKAPYHSFLSHHPENPKLPKFEGYYNIKNKTITISHANNNSFFKLETWKRILNNLLKSGLIDNNWKLIGCPPNCSSDTESNKDHILVGELLSQKSDIAQNSSSSRKERETEALVQNFRTQQAIRNKSRDLMGYMYRYGENKK